MSGGQKTSPDDAHLTETEVASESVFDGKLLHVRRDTVRLPDGSLATREYVAGEYSIADMACYPWILPERQGQDMADFPHLARWKDAIGARAAVQRAYALAKTINTTPSVPDDQARQLLFGQDRNTVR